MRRLLTGGIKAILAIAALSTAAHWAMRVQRDPATVATTAAMAAIPDPVSTGSITPRKVERALPVAQPVAQGLDQQHLLKLISGAAPEKKPQKSVVAKR
ncbi:hypothetical protein [Methylobacterium haplocladii]|uniref:Uncharacterized protein n=1 Tax=Methylobacterium haplocladii TaxID=1176176 RepID=A0A512IM61_9HYPH|nr:hypothetical protein [Methylobacterium haplocladii]GEO98775.1 hypothetical protein MHA02_11630 [Methylobacterium haplocladii]GJD85048.1 hypothetical protein HPGCJGGD_2934 [Methylobacterium haplocladii]GLS60657.1 hypothetical protein GCM10007887_33410 [Methylobacterium haplocladii]